MPAILVMKGKGDHERPPLTELVTVVLSISSLAPTKSLYGYVTISIAKPKHFNTNLLDNK